MYVQIRSENDSGSKNCQRLALFYIICSIEWFQKCAKLIYMVQKNNLAKSMETRIFSSIHSEILNWSGAYFSPPQILRIEFCAQTTEPQNFYFSTSTDSAEKGVRRFCRNIHRICGNIHRFCKTCKNMQKPQNSISAVFCVHRKISTDLWLF